MSEVVAGIGAGTVLVFQPATPRGAGFELALGVQRFWQKALKNAGRPAACFLMLTRVEKIEGDVPADLPIAVGDRGVARFEGWPNAAANGALVRSKACRWGLIATFDAAERHGRLDTQLIEAPSDAPDRGLGSWSFDGGYAEMPEHVAATLVEVGRRVGVKLPWSTAAQAFDTPDAGAMMLALELMGVLSMAEDGCRLTIATVLDRLALLVRAAPRSAVVVALVPELLGHLARLGAHDLQLAGWMKRMRSNLGVLPAEWDRLVENIVRDRGHGPS